ncbi:MULTISPECIES: hypothetical protein [Helicobacter]|uniref:Septum formation initiator n=1 Tax=Helicobacter typhlonius TaxID=76936 RepID=A0A099UFR2_9HELI|nr:MULTISPECIES: hypothetical protein [Helicobacter]TLD79190.1 hypothetical protein LS75_002520 [Helicobacter typhlonius]TLD86124.1 hypothetical protein LS67_008975 [Helicobacter sp. MIT 03-1616]CUU40528.1 Hypothetical protein BN2458_PEG1645 [Helicobacter typhlonius]HCD72627.1 hypothetical protein [Helicobacter sp.]
MSAYDELLGEPQRLKRLFYINRVWIIIFGVVIALGVYIGYLLFGNNSVEVLLSLHKQKTYFIEEAHKMQEQNALLQRQIFELKGADFEKENPKK